MMDNCEESIHTNTKPITVEEIINANLKLKEFFNKIGMRQEKYDYTVPFSGKFSTETIYLEPVKIPFYINMDEINKE